MAENLREEINAALTRIAVLDDCLHELRSEMPAIPETQSLVAVRVHWICEFLEREAEELDRVLLGHGCNVPAQQPQGLHL